MSVPNALDEEELPGITDWKSLPTDNKKHTLDSDEEDEGEEKKYEILDDDDIEGQEEGTGGFDGEVQITPFNMHEEMEEGHFDTEGNYHWNKGEKEVRDNWLENIDWVKIKEREGPLDNPDESDSEESTPFDTIPTYRKMLALMKPGESVAKAIKRWGGNKSLSASERWRRKKAGLEDAGEGNRQHVTDMTEHANKLLTETGNMDIYQETYEHIHSLVQEADRKHAAAHPAPKAYDDALDMYADDFDLKEKARLGDTSQKHKLDDTGNSSTSGASPSKKRKVGWTENDEKKGSEPSEKAAEKEEDSGVIEKAHLDETSKKHKLDDAGNSSTSGACPSKKRKVGWAENGEKKESESSEKAAEKEEDSDDDDGVMWEFKWKEDSSEIDGPHATEQMHKWVEEGYFKEPVWVRKVGQDGPFYSSRRIDFELYL